MRAFRLCRRFNSPDDTEGGAIQRELRALLERRRAESKGVASSKKLLDFSRLTSPAASRELPEKVVESPFDSGDGALISREASEQEREATQR